MPRFFFHVYDESENSDREGLELLNGEAALRMALKTAGGMIQELAATVHPAGTEWRMDVTNELGHVLFRIAAAAAALGER